MKQKYLIMKSIEKNELIIREFTESGKDGTFTLRSEEIYGGDIIGPAIAKGKQSLISVLMTPNMHPPKLYAEEITESVMKLYSSEGDQSIELFLDDKDYFYTVHI